MRILSITLGLLAATALSSCQKVPEKVVQRLASPDGRYEAVMMVCQTPSDRRSTDLLVAVFEQKGRDCDKPFVDAVAGVSLTHPDKDGVKAQIRWESDEVVLTTTQPRHFISGLSQADGRGMVRFEGPVSGAEGWKP